MNSGRLIISLDFEMFWGVHDSKTIEGYGANVSGVHQVIPALLRLFRAYEVRATFATVGFLFFPNRNSLLTSWPSLRPTYRVARRSAYEHVFAEDRYHFAFPLLEQICAEPQHELATHTFSHYYCDEPGQTIDQFKVDLECALRAGERLGRQLKSIVFPRNQVRHEYLEACKEMGLVSFRGHPKHPLYQFRDGGFAVRAIRWLDSYINLSGPLCFGDQEMQSPSGLVDVPASFFLRPYRKPTWLAERQIQRLLRAMTVAAKRGRNLHLWWHPHNFGIHLEESLAGLERILDHFRGLNQSYGMRSQTMLEAASVV